MTTIALMAAGGQARAEVYQCGKKSNYFDGWQQPYKTGSYEGAYASLITRYGAVCDTDTSNGNGSLAWTMIAAGDAKGWAQSGFWRWYNSSTYFFSQVNYTDSAGKSHLTTKFSSSPTTYGQTHTYKEQWSQSCYCEQSYVDSTLYIATSFNPYTYWYYPFSPVYSGEANYLASDMTGNSASPTVFSNLHYQDISNSFYAYGCNVLSGFNNGSAKRADGEAWYNWQTQCPSFEIFTDTYGL
jgi:hypothetical protein